ncbi:uncharacterized protein LOC134687819 [Mytilus trossulus]|uniref:uncharacterized protein LOC134687819 n=1 Tax=Mytilus trossulus TaxID=6551 RepID=UPI0030052815
MSDTGSDHDDLRPSKSKESTSNTELSTDGAVSLFSTVLTNALEQQKVNLIKHFENQFIQPVKSTGVSTPDFVFKREGHRIQYLFNTERSDTISRIEKLIRSKSYVQALEVLAEEKETLRKRNKIVKIADKHGWDTVNEYLDSTLADDKDDAANLRSAIASASRKGKVQNRMIGPAINLQKVEINSTQRIFFVGLVKTVDSEKMQVSRRTDPGNASIAINKDISPDTVHSRQVRQQQSARPQRNKKSHSKEPTLDEDTTNGVEYNFDFINNYEIKSGDQDFLS